jgi:battenin
MGFTSDLLSEYPKSKIDNSFNKQLAWKNIKVAFNHSKRFVLNLCLVYYLEYVIMSCFCDRVIKYGWIKDIDSNLLYELFSLSYQVGVFISRSCLCLLVRIKYVEIFTIMQLINFAIWMVQVYFGFFSHGLIGIVLMVYCGLMGGGSYVLCFYNVLNSGSLPEDYKELTVNVGSVFNDFGIFMASITKIVFDNTIMN